MIEFGERIIMARYLMMGAKLKKNLENSDVVDKNGVNRDTESSRNKTRLRVTNCIKRRDKGRTRGGGGPREAEAGTCYTNKDCRACPRIRLYINLPSADLPKTTDEKTTAKTERSAKKYFDNEPFKSL